MEDNGCLKYISYWIGVPVCIIICAKLFGDAGLTIGFIAGFILVYLFWKYKENEEKERYEREERDRQARWESERRERKRQEAIELARQYPEATKYYFQLFWGINKYSITDSDITYDRAVKLLSNSHNFRNEELQRNPTFKAKVEQERLRAQKEREQRLEAERRAAEQKRREELIAKQRKEEERRNLPYTLPSLVSGWDQRGSIKHKYYYEYYSYTNNKHNATSAMWTAWKTVWNFKNDPTKYIPSSDHEYALKTVVNLVENTLRSTFGSKTEYLTLVCLTASTQMKTDCRFKRFAETLCSNLKMENSYTHIRVVEGGLAKHEGGSGVSSKSYDRYFFDGKYVVLFDDVRTSGGSLEREKQILESYGAKVICAITIAQTF